MSNQILRVSAPGKTILHGEHAVVYGKAAIAVCVSLRTNITLETIIKDEIALHFSDLNITKNWKTANKIDTGFKNEKDEILLYSEENLVKFYEYLEDKKPMVEGAVSSALNAFVYIYCSITEQYGNGRCRAVNMKVSTEIPLAAGLGSSASYSVALATSLLFVYDQINKDNACEPMSKDLINKWAYQCERVIHGQPSGIDNSTCTYGGALFFKNGRICEKLENLPKMNILLVNSNVQRNTKQMVANVRIKQEIYPNIINPIMDSIESIALHQWDVLKNASINDSVEVFNSFNDLVSTNQHLLEAIGVGHRKLTTICSIAAEFGLVAKLTGAGGGGCALIFLNKENDQYKGKLREQLEREDFTVWETELAGPGVLIH